MKVQRAIDCEIPLVHTYDNVILVTRVFVLAAHNCVHFLFLESPRKDYFLYVTKSQHVIINICSMRVSRGILSCILFNVMFYCRRIGTMMHAFIRHNNLNFKVTVHVFPLRCM